MPSRNLGKNHSQPPVLWFGLHPHLVGLAASAVMILATVTVGNIVSSAATVAVG